MSESDSELMGALRHLYQQQSQMIQLLQGIDRSLGAIALASQPVPNLTRPLSEFKTFDWGSIGAIVVQSDNDGPTIISYQGREYRRRSPENKFNPAIWFSRKEGELYVRLISFTAKCDPVEPLGRKVINLL